MLTELSPVYDGRKSFYGKARILTDGNSMTLLSYGTPILKIEGDVYTLFFRDEDLSNTTMRHLREFLRQAGLSYAADKSKAEMIKFLRGQK